MNLNTKENFFNPNELSLLQNYENNLLKINLKISEQKNKKEEIACLLDTFSKLNNANSSSDLVIGHVDKTDNISKNISTNIEKLIWLKSLLVETHNLFILLFKDESFSDEDLQLLKNKIANYFSTFEEIQSNISITDIEIDQFVKEINLHNVFSVSDYITKDSEEALIDDNDLLIISEKENKVFLPYTVSEIESYIEKYPKEYKSLEHVINKEFILPLDYYTKHPSLSRFREAYSLIRDREAKSVFDALKYGINIMFNYDLNPAIISACKTEEALDFYIDCLESQNLSKFDLFKIEYRLNPMKISKFEVKI